MYGHMYSNVDFFSDVIPEYYDLISSDICTLDAYIRFLKKTN